MSPRNTTTERRQDAVARNAERILADTTYDRLRTPRALLALLVGYAATTAAIPVCWLAWGAIAGILSVGAWLVAFLLLRVAVRSQADLPDEVLDERMRSERDSVYVGAYRLLATAVFVGTNVAFVAVAFGNGDETITLDYDAVSAVYWTAFSLLLGAPSVVLANRQRSRA